MTAELGEPTPGEPTPSELADAVTVLDSVGRQTYEDLSHAARLLAAAVVNERGWRIRAQAFLAELESDGLRD